MNFYFIFITTLRALLIVFGRVSFFILFGEASFCLLSFTYSSLYDPVVTSSAPLVNVVYLLHCHSGNLRKYPGITCNPAQRHKLLHKVCEQVLAVILVRQQHMPGSFFFRWTASRSEEELSCLFQSHCSFSYLMPLQCPRNE